jgi:hypothetical protein
MKHLPNLHFRVRTVLSIEAWKLLFKVSNLPGKTCLCGRSLPLLERYSFTFRSERKADYFLGQCPGCRNIYWEEA